MLQRRRAAHASLSIYFFFFFFNSFASLVAENSNKYRRHCVVGQRKTHSNNTERTTRIQSQLSNAFLTLRAKRLLHIWKTAVATVSLTSVVRTTEVVVTEIMVKIANVDISGVVVGLLLVHHKVWTSNSTWIPIVVLNPGGTWHWRVGCQSMVPRGAKVIRRLTVLRLALAEKFLL